MGMLLTEKLFGNRMSKRIFHFSFVFILVFSCFTFFYVDTTRAVPVITIDNPIENSVIFDKTPNIKISYSDMDGINVSSVVFRLNNVDFTSSANVTSDGVSFTPPSDLPIGSYSVSVTVFNAFDYVATKTFSFIIASDTSLMEENVGDIGANELKEINLEEITTSPIIFYKIIINPAINLNDTSLIVANLSIDSIDVDKPRMSDTDLISYGAGYSIVYTNNLFIYSYFGLDFLSNDISIPESNIDSMTLKLKIKRTWIDTNNVDKNAVRLLRYKSGGWQELTTTFEKEDGVFVYYNTVTKGFSLFALVAPELLVEQEVTSGGINILIILGAVIAIIITIIGFLFWMGFLYIERD